MSNAKFHKETNCLNCGEALHGKYCSNCGQEAFLHKDSFWHMTFHFIGHYFHYDGKFWTTLKTLFTKPGLATLEYINGKRAKYLNPVQLYFFVTTFFFILVFSLTDNTIHTGPTETKTYDSAMHAIRQQADSATLQARRAIEHADSTQAGNTTATDSTNTSEESVLTQDVDLSFSNIPLATYDSIQNALPPEKRDGKIKRFFARKFHQVTDTSEDDFLSGFIDKFTHQFPKIFFLLLPWFAFSMWLVFYRYKFYFVDHLIFSIHYHAFLFLIGIFMLLVRSLHLPVSISGLFNTGMFVYAGVYLFLSLRRVFPASGMRTFLKQVFLSITYFFGFIMALLMILLFTFIFY